MPPHPHPRSPEARQRRAERRRRAKLRRLEEEAAPASVAVLPPSVQVDAAFVAAAPERIDRGQLSSTATIVSRAVEDVLKINPRGAVADLSNASKGDRPVPCLWPHETFLQWR